MALRRHEAEDRQAGAPELPNKAGLTAGAVSPSFGDAAFLSPFLSVLTARNYFAAAVPFLSILPHYKKNTCYACSPPPKSFV